MRVPARPVRLDAFDPWRLHATGQREVEPDAIAQDDGTREADPGHDHDPRLLSDHLDRPAMGHDLDVALECRARRRCRALEGLVERVTAAGVRGVGGDEAVPASWTGP